MNDFKKVIEYFLPFFKKYKKSVFATFFFYGASVVFGGIFTPLVYREIIDVISTNPEYSILVQIFFKLIVVTVLGFVLHRIGDLLIAHFQAKGMKDIYNFSFEKITLHSARFFADNFAGSLVAKTKRFVKSFESIFDSIVFSFYRTSIYLLGMFIVLLLEHRSLGIIFFIWTFVFLMITIQVNKQKIPLNLNTSKQDSRVSGQLADVITNILNVKIFSSHHREVGYFSEITQEDYQARMKQWKFDNYIWRLTGGLLLVFELVGMGLALYLWSKNILTTGAVVLIQIYIAGLSGHLWNLGRNIIRFTTSVSESVEVVNVIEKNLDIIDPKNPEIINMQDGQVFLNTISFTYPNGDHVFENFSLEIPQGQSVGIVGKSGSGKTTITKLLLRFYDVDAGSITVDGQAIDRVTQDDLRSRISYIPQESILFHRSIYENIAYGNPDATQEEVMQAAKFAHADEFISQFENGYDTKVGERGVKLSGGQRQRIAIARAMLKKDAPILVMDEATSSLDSLSEKYIQESFEKLMKNRTTIVVAHRLSTIQKMDRIIVLEKGNIVEDGSHSELIEQGGYYAELWNSQTQEIDNFFE